MKNGESSGMSMRCNFLSCIRALGNSCFCGNLDISQQVKRK
jgi:hypothetical protein